MSYVPTFDNKYVSYTNTSSGWTVTESEWEKINIEKDFVNVRNEVGYTYEFETDVIQNQYRLPIFVKDNIISIQITYSATQSIDVEFFSVTDIGGTVVQTFGHITDNELHYFEVATDAKALYFYNDSGAEVLKFNIAQLGLKDNTVSDNQNAVDFDLTYYNKKFSAPKSEIISFAMSLGLTSNIISKLEFIGKVPLPPNITPQIISNELLQISNEQAQQFGLYKWGENNPSYFYRTSPVNFTNDELYWNNPISYKDLYLFDFNNVFVKFTDDTPYYIEEIAVGKKYSVFSSDELDILHKRYRLPIFWSGNLNINGICKANRGFIKQLYTNLIKSPDFQTSSDWEYTSSGWVILSNKATCNISDSSATLRQTIAGLQVGDKYKIVVNVNVYTSGSLSLQVASGDNINETLSRVGVHEFEFTLNTLGTGWKANKLVFIPSESGFVGSIDYVEIVKLY